MAKGSNYNFGTQVVKAAFAQLYDLILEELRASYLSMISQINGPSKALIAG